MTNLLARLGKILTEELNIFNQICRLEEEKSGAIIDRNGKLLHTLSETQEEFLRKIYPLENDRNKITEQCDISNSEPNDVSLSDILLKLDASDRDLIEIGNLSEIGKELRRTLERIKSLQEVNTKLINDNLEFFNLMLKELKNAVSIETGYSRAGMEKGKISNSLLVDKTI